MAGLGRLILKLCRINLALVIILAGCATQPKPPSMKVSASSNELAAGELLHQKILSDFEPLHDDQINAYIQSIIKDLAQHAGRKLPYEGIVLKDERIYAISAPGGKIYITTSFLSFLKNEAELAAVLGHEIGQLQFLAPQFDPVKKTVNGVAQAGQMIGPLFGQIGALATLGLIALQAAYARDPDLEKRMESSDRWAMNALLEENYDPQALLSVLEHFAKYDRQALSLFYDYYQSRPITVERLKAAHTEFKNLNLAGLNLKTNFENYRDKMEGLRTTAR